MQLDEESILILLHDWTICERPHNGRMDQKQRMLAPLVGDEPSHLINETITASARPRPSVSSRGSSCYLETLHRVLASERRGQPGLDDAPDASMCCPFCGAFVRMYSPLPHERTFASSLPWALKPLAPHWKRRRLDLYFELLHGPIPLDREAGRSSVLPRSNASHKHRRPKVHF